MFTVEFLEKMSPRRKTAVLARSAADFTAVREATAEILSRLLRDPEAELKREYGALKPDLTLSDFLVSEAEIEAAQASLTPALSRALTEAAVNIHKFHIAQLEKPYWFEEFAPGLVAGRLTRPLERVGVYIPGGRAAYPSSALMNIIPARAAGVTEIVAVTPPGPDFLARPEIVAAAVRAGAHSIYKLGGAWAVGSLAYGLGGLPRVDKIVGPGSAWVTAAKMAVFGQVDIDLPAGPSEDFIIAEEGLAPASWLAWDLLSQLEHDPLAAAVLVTTSESLAREVANRVNQLLPSLERREIVEEALAKGAAAIVVRSLDEAFTLANEYAPEHLQLLVRDPMAQLPRIRRAGSIFLGPCAPIPVGDYASGPNHVLPTGGAARMFSGLSVDSFTKKSSFQYLTREALANLAPTVVSLAEAEGLFAHAQAVKVRLEE